MENMIRGAIAGFKGLLGITEDGAALVQVNGSYPELRKFASEIASGLPTTNDDESDLVKYQYLNIVDTGDRYCWSGTEWVVL